MVVRLTLLSLLLFASIPALADQKPTRSECIIGYDLDWTGVKADPYDALETMSRLRIEHQKSKRLAGMSVRSGGAKIYLQFKSRCESKEQMATELIRFWRSQDLDLPDFERLPDPIKPSPDTIDRRGPYWRDPGTPLLELRERSEDNI